MNKHIIDLCSYLNCGKQMGIILWALVKFHRFLEAKASRINVSMNMFNIFLLISIGSMIVSGISMDQYNNKKIVNIISKI